MTFSSKKGIAMLFIGDFIIFFFSLFLALFIRNSSRFSIDLFITHLIPFLIIFIFWFLVFYVAGLYDKQVLVIKSELPQLIFQSQIINSVIAVVFFYFIPTFGITPKTILFIYVAISFVFIICWRIYGMYLLFSKEKQFAILIGQGEEMDSLKERVNSDFRYNLKFISSIDVNCLEAIDVQEELVRKVYSDNVKFIVIDLSNEKIAPILPHLYNLVFSKVRFVDYHKIFEDIFNKIPLSLVNYSWFLENISVYPKFTYDFLKRMMDIVLSFVVFIPSLVIYPFVYLAIKLDDGGEIFIKQDRIGQGGKMIQIIKFRTMAINDGGEGEGDRKSKITPIGSFLRKTRIDELPQLYNVICGDMSLIGPRPELPNLVKLYEKEINFYNVRHLIKPGLSGWAQIYQKDPPKFATDYSQTKNKLSYDLFYIKNRSFILDIKIALKTIKILFSRSGI